MSILGVPVELPSSIVDGNPSLEETKKLLEIAIGLRVRSVFEIGTGNGSTVLALASVSTIEQLWTLDLPAGITTKWPLLESDLRWLNLPKPDFPDKITQLWGDSATFEGPYRGACDLVFVMGSHSRKYILNDIALARRFVSKNGIVVWHGGTPTPMELVAAEHRLLRLGDRMAVIWK